MLESGSTLIDLHWQINQLQIRDCSMRGIFQQLQCLELFILDQISYIEYPAAGY